MHKPVKSSDGIQKRDAPCEVSSIPFTINRIILLALIGTALVTPIAIAQKTVSFHTDDGGVIFADLYGPGERYARVRRLMVT
jgi:hypothetical protein